MSQYEKPVQFNALHIKYLPPQYFLEERSLQPLVCNSSYLYYYHNHHSCHKPYYNIYAEIVDYTMQNRNTRIQF